MSTATTCRSCGVPGPRPFLSLGSTPVANRLLTEEGLIAAAVGLERSYPLEVAFCPSCALVQLVEGLPADEIFDEDYPYFSSFSPALLQHAKDHALGLLSSRRLDGSSLVVELASNDGYLLRTLVDHGVPVLGIDPARGPADAAVAAGVPTMCDFFGEEVARRVRDEHGPADVVIANNVMAHVPALNDFVAGIAVLLADDGLVTIENPYVRDLVDKCEFDTVYHEHYCYFSCTAVDNLVRRHGMFLNHVEYFPSLHGGTLRWHVGKTERVSPQAREYLQREREGGLLEFSYYEGFGARVEHNREALLELLHGLRADGSRIAAYGAAAKGSTLANYVGLSTELVQYVVDRNTHKQGRYMPGTHQPIRPAEVLVQDRPDYVVLFAWNFAEEIVAQQQDYLRQGGRFIRPVPVPEVIGAEAPDALAVATSA
jgi:SAM-dependent methyltransferase